MPDHAIILLAHGSRDPLWRQPMEAVAAQVRAQAPGTPVACAYMELAEPGLADCAATLVAQGSRSIRVVPLFLGLGKHAREDLPVLVQQLRQRHPGVDVELRPAIGEHPELTALLAKIALSG